MYYLYFKKEMTLQNQKLIQVTTISRETGILYEQARRYLKPHLFIYTLHRLLFFHCKVLDTSSLKSTDYRLKALQQYVKGFSATDGLGSWEWLGPVCLFKVLGYIYLSVHISTFLGRRFLTFTQLSIVFLIPRMRICANSPFRYGNGVSVPFSH